MTIKLSTREVQWVAWGATVLVLGLTLWLAFFTYARGYQYPPCCDTAITLSKAKEIVQTKTLNPPLAYNPSFPERAYGSVFSTEIVSHAAFVGLYWLFPAAIGSLVFAKYVFVGMVLATITSFFFAVYALSRRRVTAVAAAIFFSLSYGLGVSYWQGHVAEWFGCLILPWIVVVAQRWWDRPTWSRVYPWAGLMVLLFFTHALSFLVAFVFSAAAASHRLWLLDRSRYRWRATLVMVGAVLLGLVYFRFSGSTRVLPLIDTATELVVPFELILRFQIGPIPIIPALLFGWLGIFWRQRPVIAYWAVLSYLLSQTSFLGTPFFSFRFAVFLFLPLAFIVAEGLTRLSQLIPHPLMRLAPVMVLLLYIPYGLELQYQYRQCYVQNCAGLHPTQIPKADIAAFHWMSTHLPDHAIIGAHQKFGYYLPIVTDFPVEFPVVEKRLIFTDPDPAVRARVAKDFRIQYIFWDDILTDNPAGVLEASDYRRQPFDDRRYFTKIYDQGAVIYAVK